MYKWLDQLSFTFLFTQYFEQLVIDAARMLNHTTGTIGFNVKYCQEALTRLSVGKAGDDIFVDSAARMTGLEPAEIYLQLMEKAINRAANNTRKTVLRGKRNRYQLQENRPVNRAS